MWRAPKLHLAAGAFIAAEIPLETIFMTMLLEQYKKIRYLETAQYVRTVDAAPEAGPVAGDDDRASSRATPGASSRAATSSAAEED
jgi:hypothetical protein